MKNTFKILAVVLLATTMISCKPDPKDFDAREAKLSKEIDKIDILSTYRDVMMLYFDIIEDVYNEGKESGEFDMSRLEEFENGILKDFEDKMNFNDEAFWKEADDKYGMSLFERVDEIRPMLDEIMGDQYGYEDEGPKPEFLEDGSMIIGNDTVKEINDSILLLNGDTITFGEFYEYMSKNNE